MPIRTHRGRAAVYRRLWGWPLRSPQHLAVALVLLAGLATGVGAALPRTGGIRPHQAHPISITGPSAQTAPPTTSQLAEAGIPFTSTSTPQAAPAPAAPAPDALRVIASWGKAWVHHPAGMTSGQWLDGLRPYTTDEYLTVMSSIDPANVPASAVIGNPTSVNSTVSSVQADLPTDGGTLKVLAISTGGGWRVAGYSKGP